MILCAHADAGFLNKTNSRSRAGAHIFLAENDPFPRFNGAILSRVRTLSGLYLVEPIDMDKSFNPSPQLKLYMERAMQKEKEILEKRLNQEGYYQSQTVR